MKKALLAVLLLSGLAALAAIQLTGVYGGRQARMLELREQIAERWAEADAVIEERNEILPEMVRTVRSFATREDKIFRAVTTARQELAEAESKQERIKANDELSATLANLLALEEEYPELRANADFIRLQDELAGVENRLAAERRKYNQAVQDYNTYIQLFPNNFVAVVEGFEREPAYFRTTEETRQARPAVPFSDSEGEPAEADAAPTPDTAR
ncbi:MAG: LemA family protein [Acidobacteria bacterium]|nr:LemA family protein [Acidobacteriota bacterium]